MMMGKLLLFIMFVMVLVGDSAGEDNPCPDPDNPNDLRCQNTPIEGKAGDTVILPCSRKDKMDISHEKVEWSFKDPTTGEEKSVHVYFQGKDYLQEQSDDFKDRTSLFKDQLSSGNCSLSLLVTTSHSGTYQGCVEGRLYCTVTLKVLPAGADDSSQREVTVSPDKPNNEQTQNNWTTGHIVGVAVGSIVGVAAALISVGISHYRKRRNPLCCRRNANNPQTHPNVSYRAPKTTSQDEENEPAAGNEPASGNEPADGNEPPGGN